MQPSNSDNRDLKPSTLNFKLTLKAWPVIAAATIGLCYLTQTVAKWFGIDLGEQVTVEQMRLMGAETWKILTQQGLHAALTQEVSLKFIINIPLVIAVLPLLEECVFRGLLFRLPAAKLPFGRGPNRIAVCAVLSSALFSAAHYLQMPWPDNAFIALFFFGLAQCWLYKKTAHLWCAILNHGLFNLTNLVLLFILPEAA